MKESSEAKQTQVNRQKKENRNRKRTYHEVRGEGKVVQLLTEKQKDGTPPRPTGTTRRRIFRMGEASNKRTVPKPVRERGGGRVIETSQKKVTGAGEERNRSPKREEIKRVHSARAAHTGRKRSQKTLKGKSERFANELGKRRIRTY